MYDQVAGYARRDARGVAHGCKQPNSPTGAVNKWCGESMLAPSTRPAAADPTLVGGKSEWSLCSEVCPVVAATMRASLLVARCLCFPAVAGVLL